MATGVHCIDLMRFVTGREVTALVALNDASADSPLEELLTLSVRFDDGSLGTIMTGRRTPDFVGNDVMVYGSEGRAGVRDSVDMVLRGTLDVATSADQLRGIEGDSANRYFQAFRHMIAPQIEGFEFKQRSRRPPLDPMNALLSFLYSMETVGGKAEQLGFYETVVNDGRTGFERLEGYRRVSAGQVKRAAAEFFRPSRRTRIEISENAA